MNRTWRDRWAPLTYGELEARARGMARALDHLGVAHGARVAIVSPNSGKFLTSYFGVSGYGRVLVPINFRLTADEMAYIVGHSGASVLLYDPELSDVVAGSTSSTASRSTGATTPT